jgi:hypothetical protein
MNPSPATNLYKRHRFPADIISHCVWLYFRFCLSYRNVAALMAECGIMLTYEAIRDRWWKFGQEMGAAAVLAPFTAAPPPKAKVSRIGFGLGFLASAWSCCEFLQHSPRELGNAEAKLKRMQAF